MRHRETSRPPHWASRLLSQTRLRSISWCLSGRVNISVVYNTNTMQPSCLAGRCDLWCRNGQGCHPQPSPAELYCNASLAKMHGRLESVSTLAAKRGGQNLPEFGLLLLVWAHEHRQEARGQPVSQDALHKEANGTNMDPGTESLQVNLTVS